MSATAMYLDLVGDDEDWSDDEDFYSEDSFENVDEIATFSKSPKQKLVNCDICKKEYVQSQFEAHLNGKKHINQLYEIRVQKERKDKLAQEKQIRVLFNCLSIPRILGKILSYLPLHQFLSMRLVSSVWNQNIERKSFRDTVLNEMIIDEMDIEYIGFVKKLDEHFILYNSVDRFSKAVNFKDITSLVSLEIYLENEDCISKISSILSIVNCREIRILFTSDNKTKTYVDIRPLLYSLAKNEHIQSITLIKDHYLDNDYNILEYLQESSATELSISTVWFHYLKESNDIPKFEFNNSSFLSITFIPLTNGSIGYVAAIWLLTSLKDGENNIERLSFKQITYKSTPIKAEPNEELSNVISDWISLNPPLNFLDISYNNIGHFSLDCLASNTNLKTFIATNCTIECMETLFSFPSPNITLEKLNISHCDVQRLKERMILNLPSGLKCFDFSSNLKPFGGYKITESALTAIGKRLPHLEELYIAGNSFDSVNIVKGLLENTNSIRKLTFFNSSFRNITHGIVEIFEKNTSIIESDIHTISRNSTITNLEAEGIANVLKRNETYWYGRKTKAVKG